MKARAKEKYRRTHYIVDKNIQYRFAGLLLFYMLAFFVISTAVIYLSGWNELLQKMSNVYPQARLIVIMDTIYLRLLFGFLVLIPLALFSAIMVSHKIAGPLVRIKRALRQITSGDYNVSITLRKHDQLKDVADHINKLAEALKKRSR